MAPQDVMKLGALPLAEGEGVRSTLITREHPKSTRSYEINVLKNEPGIVGRLAGD